MTPHELKRLASVRRAARTGEARARRIENHISLREMASALNVQPSTLTRWETGRSTPRGEIALQWAELLETTG